MPSAPALEAPPAGFVPVSLLAGASCVWPAAAPREWPPGLTAAERGVLPLLVAGCSNKEIAAALGKSEPTVKHQVSSILDKAAVHSRTQLVARLLRGRI